MSSSSEAFELTYQIRIADSKDINQVYEMAIDEGWNPGLLDAVAAAQGMPEAFWVGILNNRVIASIAATLYSDSLGYISFFLVKPEFRQQGYGLPLWKAALERLGSRNICLDAMPTQAAIYQQLGFKTQYAICSYRYVNGAIEMPPNLLPLQVIQGDTLESVLAYDEAFFPAKRSFYMRQWLSQANAFGVAWVEDKKILGYGLIRQAQQGFRIGPLYADNKNIASSLLQALFNQAKGETVSISMAEANPATQDLVQNFNLKSGSQLQRMYTQTPIVLPTDRIFGITNFTFG